MNPWPTTAEALPRILTIPIDKRAEPDLEPFPTIPIGKPESPGGAPAGCRKSLVRAADSSFAPRPLA